MPLVHHPPAAEQLVGGIILDPPLDLAVGEVVEPLEQEGPKVDAQLEFSADPPFALGGGVVQVR